MKTNEFNKVVDELVEKINTTLKKKAAEYNLDDDRLSVFKRAAAIQHETAPQALLGMMMKHVVSICDYVAEDKKFTRELALEKFGDNLNYLILLFALLQEEGFAESKKVSMEDEIKINLPFNNTNITFDDTKTETTYTDISENLEKGLKSIKSRKTK